MSDELGKILDERYRLDAILGSGESTVVYRAHDLRSERDVAIKRIQAVDPRDRARFLREVRMIAKLRGPHTAKMFDYGELAEGDFFLVLELVGGRDLIDIMAERGQLQPAVALSIASQVLESLREAHHVGIVHRNVKLQSIRVLQHHDQIDVKLLGFGMARTFDGEEAITRAGELVGTPRYMAPEQLLVQSISRSADIYSVGLVLLEMLFGMQVVPADPRERLRPDHSWNLPPDVSPSLRALVLKMTARDPEERYGNVEGALAAIAALHAEPHHELPVAVASHDKPAIATPSTNHSLLGRVALVVVSLAAIALIGLVLGVSNRGAKPAQPAPAKPQLPPSILATSSPPEDTATVRPKASCGSGDARPGSGWGRATVGVVGYEWLQHVPPTYDPDRKHPLVVLLAREAMDETQFLDESGFRTLSNERGFIVIVPKPKTTTRDLAADVGVIEAMVENVKQQLCIDADRVFAVGHGSGGHAARRLSCRNWIRAAAEGSARPNIGVRCEQKVPYAVLSPLRARREPLAGGSVIGECEVRSELLSLADYESHWLDRHGCKGEPRALLRDGKSVCHEWTCDVEPFMHCRIDGGQSWPGQTPRSKCDGDLSVFPAARAIWEFFERAAPASEALD